MEIADEHIMQSPLCPGHPWRRWNDAQRSFDTRTTGSIQNGIV
jgi:hypothetical protein